jgi:ABC-type Zn uptake system ZnuABC Zn-binding protein ZnuA
MAAHMVDVLNAVTLVNGQAQAFGEDHPEHAEDIEKFVQELNRITIELRSALYPTQSRCSATAQ